MTTDCTFAAISPIEKYFPEYEVRQARHPLLWEKNVPFDGTIKELIANFKAMTGNAKTHITNAKKAQAGDNQTTTTVMVGFVTGGDYYPEVARATSQRTDISSVASPFTGGDYYPEVALTTSQCPQRLDISTKFVRTAKFIHLAWHMDAIVDGWAKAVNASEERRALVRQTLVDCITEWKTSLATWIAYERKRAAKEAHKQAAKADGTKSSKKRLVIPTK